jgi:small-conductance mechanosensitive channel
VGRALVWAVVGLLVLDNLGVDVTALVTGLGIGGVAVALALQNVLSDLFASLSIVLDKPFVVGDFIVVGDSMGSVEHVGLKTTRLRSLSGEQLVVSNSDLLGSRIRNYQRMSERRAVFQLGVTYETPPDKLRAIPAILRAVIEAQSATRFDRSHFKSYGAFSLDFETVYYVLTPDYNRYMDIQEAINLELLRHFTAHGIEFAYPTSTVLARVRGEATQDVLGPGASEARA